MAAQCAHCNGLMIKKYLDDTARGDFPCLVCGLVCKTYTQYKGHMREIKSTAYPVLSLRNNKIMIKHGMATTKLKQQIIH